MGFLNHQQYHPTARHLMRHDWKMMFWPYRWEGKIGGIVATMTPCLQEARIEESVYFWDLIFVFIFSVIYFDMILHVHHCFQMGGCFPQTPLI